jgi:hypothetical protein
MARRSATLKAPAETPVTESAVLEAPPTETAEAPKPKKKSYTHGVKLEGAELQEYIGAFAKVKDHESLIRDAGYWTRSVDNETGEENEVLRRADFFEAMAIAQGVIEPPAAGTRATTSRNRKPTATISESGGFVIGKRHTETAGLPAGAKVWIEATAPAEGEEYGTILVKFHEAPLAKEDSAPETEEAGETEEEELDGFGDDL